MKQTAMHVGHNTQEDLPTCSAKCWIPKNQSADLQALSFGLSLHFLTTNNIQREGEKNFCLENTQIG